MNFCALTRTKNTNRYGVYALVLSLFFSIHSFAQPANDACASSQLIASATGLCNSVAGTLKNNATSVAATATAGINAFCGLATSADVWYRFVAQSTNPTITLSGMQSSMDDAPRLQLFNTASCTVATLNANSNNCVSGTNVTTLSLTAIAPLTIGNTYLVRVFTINSVAVGAANTWNFNICVSDPPANDLCGGAVSINSAPTCNNTVGTLIGSTYTAIPVPGCGAINVNDVWYSFTAQTTNPTITISAFPANTRIQLFSGTCAALVSVSCNSPSIVAAGLTIGTTYYVRVYSTTNATGTFNICITDPVPANNTCATSVLLTSSSVCANTAGTVYAATNSAPTISAPDCAVGVTYDVWYRFVAQTTNPTITLSSIGSSFTNASLQLLSGACGGLTPLFCSGSTLAANFLTPGTSYLIRVYSTGAAPTGSANAGFNICVTDPVTPPPSNDNCSGAINLPVFNVCSNNPGNMAGATASGVPLGGLCTGPNAYDVWYRFVAANATATVTLSSLGANFTNSAIEVFSGSCGALVSIACANGLTVTATPLVPGNTYYVRVYSRTGPPPNGHARFNICLTTTGLPVRFGNSYVNISKKTNGGVVEPGDTLEIRMTINHTSGTMYNLRYVDNVPSKTAMLTGATDRIRVITNEGLIYKQYTLAGGDDAATYKAIPGAGENNIRMNLAFGATAPGTPANNTGIEFASATGQMAAGADRPRGGGGMIFATAYRVKVTGVIGDTINLNPGQFIYKNGGGPGLGADVSLTATPFKIVISAPLNLCSNSIGINNASEYGGTFGSGSTLNRSTDLTIPIAGYTFISEVNAYNGVGDGRYALVKNISPRSGTLRTARRRNTCAVPAALAFDDLSNCNNRMFDGFWYIDGDHSGTSNSIGNNPPSGSTNGSYMLMVNADYVASEVFRQSITNLCPNTYYEFSGWVRNICPTCGIDSTGAQFTGTPTAPTGGYPGVYPNLSFSLNDVDYYNTGEIDTVGWRKKGFVFRTGPTQTSAVFSIRNNAQGGGGNDWVLDDIAVATCLPTMSYSPTINPNVCQANPIDIADTISSFFNNYTSYKWQRSTNGGASWTDITGVTTLPDTNYYITTFTVPPANTTLADSGNLYRVVVATTPANLVDPSCNISDGVTITLSVLDCGPVLDVDLLTFNGKLVNKKANLAWSTTHEDSPVKFIIERSTDGRSFSKAGESPGYNNGNNNNYYSFIDPVSVTDRVWYRIAMVTLSGKKKYSSIIQLYNRLTDFEITNIINPFNNNLTFDITIAENSMVTSELIDMSGRTISSTKQMIYAGTNSMNLGTESLPAGIYTLRVVNKNKYVVKRVVKRN